MGTTNQSARNERQQRRCGAVACAALATCAALAVLQSAPLAGATTYTWTRGAANNNWDAATNWTGGAPPVTPPPADTTDILFAGTAATATTTSALRQDYSISSLAFASDFVGSGTSTVNVTTASALLAGATSANLTIGAGGIKSDVTTFNLTIAKNAAIANADLIVPVDQTWATNAPAAGTGAITFSINRQISGAGHVTKTGPGVLVFGMPNANTAWTGGIDLVEGSLRTGGLTGGSNGQFGTGTIGSTSNNDVTITASTVSAAGGGGDRLFDNDLTLGGTGRLTFGGSFNLGFSANSQWTLTGDKKIGTSFVTQHDGTVSGNFGLSKFLGGMLKLTGANTYTGATTINEGVVDITSSTALGTGPGAVTVVPLGTGTIGAALQLSNDITVAGHPLSISGNGVILAAPVAGVDSNAGALRNKSGNNTWTGVVTVTDPNTYIALDAGELNLSGGVGGTGSARVAGGGSLRSGYVRTAGLQIDGATKVKINANGAAAGHSTVNTLTLAGTPLLPTATLDLTNNALAIDYDVTSPIADVRSMILAGRAAGLWTGPGLTSSSAATDPTTALGYAEATDLPSVPPIFGTVTGGAVLVRDTLIGDTNLDGNVNFNDLLTLAQNYGTLTSGVWSRGDFDYDGNINFNDLLALAQAYGKALPAGSLSGDWAMTSAVPEPTALAGALLLTGLLQRRSRRH